MAEHIRNNATAILFAIIPGRALGFDHIAFKHPVINSPRTENFSEKIKSIQLFEFQKSHSSQAYLVPLLV